MSRFDAVIFDMDGVIVDSEPIHKMSFLELWQEMGYGLAGDGLRRQSRYPLS